MSGRRQDRPAGRDCSVRKAGSGVQSAQRGQHVEEIAEGRIDAGRRARLGGGLEEVRQAMAGHELRHDDEAAVGVAFEGAGAGNALVFEAGDPFDALAQQLLEGGELRPDGEPFEHGPFLAVEREGPAAQAVGMAGRGRGGDRRQRRAWRSGHCRVPTNFATGAPPVRFRVEGGNRLQPWGLRVRAGFSASAPVTRT